jgi:hypothetical protein
VGRAPLGGGAVDPLGGRELFARGTYLFITKYGRKIKYVFWWALCLVEIF